MVTHAKDKTVPPDLAVWHGTGPVRSRRPIYRNQLPPCNHACPAGENIQAWLADAQAGRYEAAWRTLVRDNPLPAVHGRVCYHPCESACNRTSVDSAVSIHAVERFLGDLAIAQGWQLPQDAAPSGKKVLVVGAGPSGLSCAWQLKRRGHEVEIRDAGPLAGGMLHFGIPAYRLPRDVLQAEIHRLEQAGINIVLNQKVEDVLADMRHGGFNAAFIAIGAHISRRADIPARDCARVLDAVSFLRDVGLAAPPQIGRRVAIYGGGNTAMDAARTARRLGAEEALIIYRRDREHMPAHAFEADEALAEGIKIHWLRSIRDIAADSLQVEVMQLDAEGRAQPTGRIENLAADTLILALGQDIDSALLQHLPGMRIKADGTVEVDANMMTGYPGIFAGGDMVPSERTVTVAVGHGKHAARCIDAWLAGARYERAPARDTVGAERLHVWYLAETARTREHLLDPTHRMHGFAEIVASLNADEARFEAGRCFSCGNCFECDGCYAACPEGAIQKLGPGRRYDIDYARCTGCAACYEQCPCHAIEMEAEPVAAEPATRELP
ncbi:MAG: NAD(P)-binding protein [Rhodocyclaceae bacterium]|nr:NAD(P)-binding protein [Rhodocyclaceae bacterium]MBX3671153.1 NAD(P)-binding protein [Rhodocyclaceae bacterium]